MCAVQAKYEFTAQLRGGYFAPTSDSLSKIYRHGGGEIEGEAAWWFHEKWNLWGNINAFWRTGYSVGLHDKTTIKIYPFSAGFKYVFPISSLVSLYLGAGASYTLMRIHDTDFFIPQHQKKNMWGIVTKSGALISRCGKYFLDVFADYYYTKPTLSLFSHNIGGVRAGAGIGYRF